MTAQTELIHVRCPQVVTSGSTMRVVAVGTAHLSFTQRVVVGQAHFSALALVTFQTSIIGLPSRLHNDFAFRDQVLHSRRATRSHHVKARLGFRPSFAAVVVSLMAVNATDLVRSVRTGNPVPDFGILGMTTQADAVSVGGGTLAKRDDLRNVSAARHVQAPGTMARLAIKTLLSMKGMPETGRDIGVARRAGLGTDRRGAGNLHVLCEGGDPVGRLFLC
jgi:hypothetical protein